MNRSKKKPGCVFMQPIDNGSRGLRKTVSHCRPRNPRPFPGVCQASPADSPLLDVSKFRRAAPALLDARRPYNRYNPFPFVVFLQHLPVVLTVSRIRLSRTCFGIGRSMDGSVALFSQRKVARLKATLNPLTPIGVQRISSLLVIEPVQCHCTPKRPFRSIS